MNPPETMDDSLRRALDDLIGGDALAPGDDRYDEVRAVWNGRFDRRPESIACCTSAEDVSAAVTFARAHDLSVSVKGGGHMRS